ncbi:BREX-3 system phosphatase PglZ [Sulfobacillus thermosulfidooxidans]|uniref:BREX-3 system phosphatase PglZ n=1 Tax=Sulfobacillus thermosulfidooxidans TaxID=28034 RepID=UPI0006B47A26|nr:BREX-3 system phosphatase PglZ [Sulfobacillus thermosulfidooxidans]
MTWRQRIVDFICASSTRVRVVSDPASLLLDEALLALLQEQGIVLLTYEDPLRFRLVYEEDFRMKWDQHQSTPDLVVRTDDFDFHHLPYDLVSRGFRLYLSLGQIFPHLDLNALQDLDSRAFDLILESPRYPRRSLSYEESLVFIMRTLYRVDPELVGNEEDLLALIFRIHSMGFGLPSRLATWLSASLSQHWHNDIMLSEVLTSKEKWQQCLANWSQRNDLLSLQGRYWLKRLGGDDQIGEQKVIVGEETYQGIEEFLHREHIVGLDWIDKAYDMARIYLAAYLGDDSRSEITKDIDRIFYEWVLHQYALMASLPSQPRPKMVHHIPQWISRQDPSVHNRWALVVLDGLSLPEWIYLRQFLPLRWDGCDQWAAMAWVPSITSVSRQAIFSGRIPRAFAGSIYTTQGEEKAWKTFWKEQGMDLYRVLYRNTVDTMTVTDFMQEIDSRDAIVVGCVANMVDDLAHHAQMGMKQILIDLKQWMKDVGWLSQFIKALQDRHFHIVITSDHGHTPVRGIGKPPTGSLSATKGERVQIFGSDTLRRGINHDNRWGIDWPFTHTLPPGTYPLLARAHEAFNTDAQGVSHGSISWEELMVPVVIIW